jgi:hypothetical protein
LHSSRPEARRGSCISSGRGLLSAFTSRRSRAMGRAEKQTHFLCTLLFWPFRNSSQTQSRLMRLRVIRWQLWLPKCLSSDNDPLYRFHDQCYPRGRTRQCRFFAIQSMFEFCVTFCWSTVYSHVRPCTTVYRGQTTYEISSLFVSRFAGVTGQRSNQLNYVPNRGINGLP